MLYCKSLIKLLLVIAFSSVALISCERHKPAQEENRKIGKGNIPLGGNLSVNEPGEYITLYPSGIMDIVSMHIASQVYDGLVKFNSRNLNIQPNLVETWLVDSSETVYTFYLKKGAKFQNDPCFRNGVGREITAKDFIYSFELLCTDVPENMAFMSTFKDRVKGASKYFEESAKGVPKDGIEGIQLIDDYTFEITLEKPNAMFIRVLANPATFVVPHEAIKKYGKKSVVGSGPFIASKSGHKLNLIRNQNYHRNDVYGNQLPYLDTVTVSFILSKDKEIAAFKRDELDLVTGLYNESIKHFVKDNKKEFSGNAGNYVLERSDESASVEIYTLRRKEVNQFFTNYMNYKDFAEVYRSRSVE